MSTHHVLPLPLGYVKRHNFHVLNIPGDWRGISAPVGETAGLFEFLDDTQHAPLWHTYVRFNRQT